MRTTLLTGSSRPQHRPSRPTISSDPFRKCAPSHIKEIPHPRLRAYENDFARFRRTDPILHPATIWEWPIGSPPQDPSCQTKKVRDRPVEEGRSGVSQDAISKESLPTGIEW